MKPENRIYTDIPDSVLDALSRVRCKYSTLCHVFHCIQLFSDTWVGVAGDGGNGCYEYFIWKGGRLECSDCGYGATEWALRDVLVKEAA